MRRPADVGHLVVVPDDPGPLLPLSQVDAERTDVDEVLDDMFGEVDDDGPGITDAVLLTGGAAAVIVSQVVVLPAIVLIGGIAGLALGSVLPVRSGFRRFRGRQRDAKIQSLIGDDHLLDVRSPDVNDLVAAHRQALALAESLSEVERLRVGNVAHGLVIEVAMLLDGHNISSDTEARYVADRLQALRNLLAVLGDAVANRTNPERNATVEARIKLDDESQGTAIDEAEWLAEDLRPNRGD